MAHKLQPFFEGLVRSTKPLSVNYTYDNGTGYLWYRTFVCNVTVVEEESVEMLVRQVHIGCGGEKNFGSVSCGYGETVPEMLRGLVEDLDKEFFDGNPKDLKFNGVEVHGVWRF